MLASLNDPKIAAFYGIEKCRASRLGTAQPTCPAGFLQFRGSPDQRRVSKRTEAADTCGPSSTAVIARMRILSLFGRVSVFAPAGTSKA